MKSGVLTFVAGCGLLIPASIGLLYSGVPTPICPFPFLTITPAFLLSSWLWAYRLTRAAVFVPSLLFLAWNPGLYRGHAQVPKRSLVLLAAATLLSVVWFIAGWKYGLQYQGAHYTYSICLMNVVWLVLLWVIFIRCWRRRSFTGNLLFQWVLFAWLAWCAFPYLGELP